MSILGKLICLHEKDAREMSPGDFEHMVECLAVASNGDVVASMRGVGTMIFLFLSSVGREGELHVSVIGTKKQPSEAHVATSLCDVYLGSHSLFHMCKLAWINPVLSTLRKSN